MDRDEAQVAPKERHQEDHHDDEEVKRIRRSEEELRVDTHEHKVGEVKVSKQVHTEHEQLRVPKVREEVSIDRIPVDEEIPGAEIGEEEISVPVVEEEVVAEKRPVVKEEIRVRKGGVIDEELVEENLRKEDINIENPTESNETGTHPLVRDSAPGRSR
jgi:uncharacterized protein (TIGR02271 family)